MELLFGAGPWLVQGGAVALLFWVARLVFVGKLVPASTLDRERAVTSDWRTAYFTQVEINRELSGQLGPFLATARKAGESV